MGRLWVWAVSRAAIQRYLGAQALQWSALVGLGYLLREGDVAWRNLLLGCGAMALILGIGLPLAHAALRRRGDAKSFARFAASTAAGVFYVPLAWYLLPTASQGGRIAELSCLFALAVVPGVVVDGYERELQRHRAG